MTQKIYLDACIFTSFKNESHPNHEVVKKSISSMEKLDIEIYSSEWALFEMIKVLIKDYGFQKSKAEKIAKEIKTNSKIGNLKINWIEIDGKKYKFNDFFEYLKNKLIDSKKLPIADAIHCLLMEQNQIDLILTTDSDFEALHDVTSISPKVLSIINPK